MESWWEANTRGRATTSVTMIMTDARIGFTISTYHHQLVMSNEGLIISNSLLTHPREGVVTTLARGAENRQGWELCGCGKEMKKLWLLWMLWHSVLYLFPEKCLSAFKSKKESWSRKNSCINSGVILVQFNFFGNICSLGYERVQFWSCTISKIYWEPYCR